MNRLALALGAGLAIVVSLTGIAAGDPYDGVLRGLLEGGVFLGAYAVLGSLSGNQALRDRDFSRGHPQTVRRCFAHPLPKILETHVALSCEPAMRGDGGPEHHARREGASAVALTHNMLAAVGSDESVRIVEQFLAAFNRHRLDRLIRLTTADQSISLPDGTAARGRLATGRLIAWVLWRSRGNTADDAAIHSSSGRERSVGPHLQHRKARGRQPRP